MQVNVNVNTQNGKLIVSFMQNKNIIRNIFDLDIVQVKKLIATMTDQGNEFFFFWNETSQSKLFTELDKFENNMNEINKLLTINK